jgi:hypothetical protein
MRRMLRRSMTLCVAIAIGVAMHSISAPAASASHADGGAKVVPARFADGLTGSELLGQITTPFYTSPITADLSCMRVGKTGDVLYAATRHPDCTIERGTPVLFSWWTTCDDVVDPTVDPTYYGADEAAQRECAVRLGRAFVTDLWITVDGGPQVHFRNESYEFISAQQHVQMPLDNFYGISPRPVTFVAHSWIALVKKLSLGSHTIEFGQALSTGESQSVIRVVNVVKNDDHS